MVMSKSNKKHCRQCQHYYITWDESFPYGCRALGFKSRRLPMEDVHDTSGVPCLSFEDREDGQSKERKR